MLDAIGASPGSTSEIDWHKIWRSSPEYLHVQAELERLRFKDSKSSEKPWSRDMRNPQIESASYEEFAVPLWDQFVIVVKRTFEQGWRTPLYIHSKMALCMVTSLSIELSP